LNTEVCGNGRVRQRRTGLGFSKKLATLAFKAFASVAGSLTLKVNEFKP
jgi:hypothetical protein